eukprot:TRINITY_DN1043_c0_g1_i1.p2 TRINITY_DN1043_c0_g1~~TRINITY_DN1043_c0_g1_i1.p2  ORF type:complete len:126 (+),score=43.54 TRINITY_DN1043_c0_g1_i1:90-467(+)
MSWDAYVKQLTDQKFVDAGVYGIDGTRWAASNGLASQDAIIKGQLAPAFKNADTVRQNGVKFGATKYMIVKADPDSIYGKTTNGGFIASKTNKAIVIAVYGEAHQPGAAAVAVEKVADYLKSSGY